MFQSHFKDGLHMVIGQGIEDVFALPAVFDQVHLLEHPQLVGDCTLGDLDALGDVAHALLTLGQQIEDMNPGGVCEALEQIRNMIHGLKLVYGNRVLIRDGNDNRYEIPDLQQLDKHSRQQIDSFL